MSVTLLRADARSLPLGDSTVDLIVTSPPYFGLRSYQDGGKHYTGQVGDEATPAEFVDALIECTREMVRVLKPSGSIWVNLGDKYAGSGGWASGDATERSSTIATPQQKYQRISAKPKPPVTDVRAKSLIGIPWRYAIRCIDDLGLILRAEVIWSKPNGLPESVTDRVRRSHETWFHFTREPRYFSAVDEIREEALRPPSATALRGPTFGNKTNSDRVDAGAGNFMGNPLGKLPGSVWTVATEPLHVPESLGVDHFAAFPTEFPRRIIQGWSPSGICTECGEGRRPVAEATGRIIASSGSALLGGEGERYGGRNDSHKPIRTATGWSLPKAERVITGEACACPEPTAPTRPAVVLDPFGGTGTTALVADVLGRDGISVDMSADYCRLAQWRTTDLKQRAKAARTEHKPPVEVPDGQATFDLDGIGA